MPSRDTSKSADPKVRIHLPMRDFLRDPIVESAAIAAPLARIWALSTRVELVRETLGMSLAGGVTQGHIAANSRVHWRGWKFGLPTNHHTLITQFAAPHPGRIGDPAAEFDGQDVAWFEDSQEKGRFATFHHMHLFRQYRHEVRLEDRIHFALPFGPLGQFAAQLLLAPHIRRLAQQRFAMIKRLAEGDGWQQWAD
jgi:ligand-binding SRPBCC domain-containing protein